MKRLRKTSTKRRSRRITTLADAVLQDIEMTNGPIKKSSNSNFLNVAKKKKREADMTKKAKGVIKKKKKRYKLTPEDLERVQKEAKRRGW